LYELVPNHSKTPPKGTWKPLYLRALIVYKKMINASRHKATGMWDWKNIASIALKCSQSSSSPRKYRKYITKITTTNKKKSKIITLNAIIKIAREDGI